MRWKSLLAFGRALCLNKRFANKRFTYAYD